MKMDTQLLAASADNLEDATKTVKEKQLTFPVAHGLEAKDFSSKTGAYFDEKGFVHATGFLINRDGKIIVASYSTGAIGRLTPQDCLGLITYLQTEQTEE